ncbi:hypothetical protein GCM10008995_02390 [Halobellus salinus]|uniref:DUF7718 domain-containing protein n=1 Tax=Halobellus salinus TaxID=931585 RepID=A0A830EC54_9EURY|nr:hypothetical protein GCM10008995_02390 [Halobellus salinus]SMP12593.1 hypothetical protein SAMN06265347_10486 [Halobellus salinus]
MHKLRTLNLPPHRGREFFATVFVEPAPDAFDSFDLTTDATQWGVSIHFQPNHPYASHVEIARIDTEHGEPHFDRLYEPDQRKDWLGHDYTYEDARRELLSNWREYADQFLENHYCE